MIPLRLTTRLAFTSKPRASGDDPFPQFSVLNDGYVNPARAGMIRLFRLPVGDPPGKPRASGDDPLVNVLGLVLPE